MIRGFGCATLLTCLVAVASAEPTVVHDAAQRGYVVTPLGDYVSPHADVSPVLYLERCSGGCTVKKGANSAATNTSTIVNQGGSCTDATGAGCQISEYVNADGLTGAAADAEWAAVVQCVKEVYSPYQVTVTDQRPTEGSYHLAVVAGNPSEIGLGNDILGVAPLASNCSAIDNVMSFSFANHHQRRDLQRVNTICWTAAQESAHAFGLDHTFAFLDNRSTCNDPMTYRSDCTGQRFFRNVPASCGEYEARACRCAATQNSHKQLAQVFGEKTPTVPVAEATIVTPRSGTVLGQVVVGTAYSQRGVRRVDLRLNGSTWNSMPGDWIGGAAMPTPYQLAVPANPPVGVIDVVLRACDDLGICGESPAVRITAGTCSADNCTGPRSCDGEGRCVFPEPIGALGDDCEYSEYCLSELCSGTAERKICTQSCFPGDANACTGGMSCVGTGGNTGICLPPEFGDDGGCCSVGAADRVPWVQLSAALGMFGLLVIRRRSSK